MNRLFTIFLFAICLSIEALAQQRFYNLTADEVRIDSTLPSVAYYHHIPQNYSDSVYSIQLKYPEFLDMPAGDIERYKAIAGNDLPAEMPVIDQFITKDRNETELTAVFCPVVYREGKYQFLVSFMAQTTSAPAQSKGVRKVSSADRYTSHSVLSTGKWAKIRVSSTGIHELTSDIVKKAGFSDLSKVKIYGYGGNLVPEVLTDAYLTEFDDLKEVPTCTVGGRRLFFAKGSVYWNKTTDTERVRNPYSDYGYYFITSNDSTATTCTETELVNEAVADPVSFHSLYEPEEFSFMEGGRNLYSSKEIYSSSSASFTVSSTNPKASTKVTVAIAAKTQSQVEVLINDSVLGKQNIKLGSYDEAGSSTGTYTVKNLKESNKVTLKVLSGGPARLDYICQTMLDSPANPDLENDKFPVPEYVYNITNQDLHADGDNGYDMVIIIPASAKLKQQAQRLADFHEAHDSLKVRIVPADEIFNEFSSGTPDASAYKRYMKMLYDKAELSGVSPKYLLLFGDAIYDNRMRLQSSSADDYLLCFESENSFNEINCFVSDDFFVTLEDNEAINNGTSYKGTPDAAVGRFPCKTVDEAKVLVDKTLAYANNTPSGAWQNKIYFLGDDGNNNLHMNDVNIVADNINKLHPEYNINKVMWDAYQRESSATGNRYPEISSLLKNAQNDGALIFDYAGHGSSLSISHEMVLSINDFGNFRGNNYSLWVTASCSIMPFDGTKNCIGEVMMLNSKGGSVAFFGTSRTVLSSYNKIINQMFMRNVLSYDNDGKPITIGEAYRITKTNLVKQGKDLSVNKLQYLLFGDPALRLALPTCKTVIDSINGIDIKNTSTTLKAGSIVKIKGHVESGDSLNSSFNGTVDALVRDTEERVVCRMNDTTERPDTAFSFNVRNKVIFHGTSEVKNGTFELCFTVSKDINYGATTGLITTYAVDKTNRLAAHGVCSNFYVNGSENIENDSIGPSIFCYLNTPDFAYGGTVNPTPYFVAQISDSDGINASGSSIGHDMQLIIDNNPSLTYNLNSNFAYDFGSYTSGQTYYIIPTLEAGNHTLLFRAWDILNNCSTATLSFNVQSNLQPDLLKIYATNNPAKDSTTFVAEHNFIGSEVTLKIEVMDASGRTLWSDKVTDTTTDGIISFPWDLSLDSGGILQTGVYLYRVSLSSNSSNYTSEAKKLIVVR